MFLFTFFFTVFTTWTSAYPVSNWASGYDENQLQIGAWLSGAAYCDDYSHIQIGGPAAGFIYDTTIHDPKTDIKGYIGTLHKNIYVVLRGSSSVRNWLSDFEARLVPYDTFPECDCHVHHGFYQSALSITNQTVDSLYKLQSRNPGFPTIVIGHSYGASSGQLLAMELRSRGIASILYTYGQPRVGDAKYAAFMNIPLYRVTHHKDLVPHVPPTKGLGYLHSCTEIYEDADGHLTICASCEDPACADQFDLLHTNITDHSYYMGHHLGCADSSISTTDVTLDSFIRGPLYTMQ